MITQGLRPTSSGGHIAVYDAVMAQFGNVLGDMFRRFAWMRRLRNTSEYPSIDQPVASTAETVQAQKYARAMLDSAQRLIDQLPVY